MPDLMHRELPCAVFACKHVSITPMFGAGTQGAGHMACGD